VVALDGRSILVVPRQLFLNEMPADSASLVGASSVQESSRVEFALEVRGDLSAPAHSDKLQLTDQRTRPITPG
jgi:hypothetical protein